MPKLEKGQHAQLNVTQEGTHRVFAGLGWDPNENFGIMDEAKAMMGGKKVHHDLDLSCFAFDSDQNLIAHVTAENASNDGGHIYHSGDNVEGLGDGDDEEVSVELKDLDQNIAHIVFITTIKSGHTFCEIEMPEIRLTDGYSGHNFLTSKLDCEEGKSKAIYVFAALHRTADVWNLHYIDEFMEDRSRENLEDVVKPFLSTSP